MQGDYLVRVDDTLEFQPGWLERSIEALEADPDIGCLSLVPPPGYHRGRGRPRTVHVEPLWSTASICAATSRGASS